MPIRINLLAEAQAAEEERRKDPVKRGTYVAGFLVCLVVLWAASLQVKILGARSEMKNLEAKWKSIEKDYQTTVETQRGSMEAEAKLSSLHQMTTNRFLWGNVLNAFQQTLGGIDGVQVVRFKGEQSYALTEGTANRTNGTAVVPGKPATATERISMNVEARDTSPQPGKLVNEFKESIANVSFFKENLTRTNGVLLTSRSAPQGGPDSPDGKQTFVMFSLKCSFPEKTR
jgi:hypothetical protein